MVKIKRLIRREASVFPKSEYGEAWLEQAEKVKEAYGKDYLEDITIETVYDLLVDIKKQLIDIEKKLDGCMKKKSPER